MFIQRNNVFIPNQRKYWDWVFIFKSSHVPLLWIHTWNAALGRTYERKAKRQYLTITCQNCPMIHCKNLSLFKLIKIKQTLLSEIAEINLNPRSKAWAARAVLEEVLGQWFPPSKQQHLSTNVVRTFSQGTNLQRSSQSWNKISFKPKRQPSRVKILI